MSPRDHLRGVLVGFVAFCFFVLGMPGMDLLDARRWLPGSQERARVMTAPWGPIAVGAADLNRAVREPVVRLLKPLQPPLRLAQSWSLYGSGVRELVHFEIHVDEELVFRTHDPEHQWLRSELRYRRLRPILDAHCAELSRNSRGLMAYIVRRAREDFPGAESVVSACVVRPRREPGPVTVRQRRIATAPDWWIRS